MENGEGGHLGQNVLVTARSQEQENVTNLLQKMEEKLVQVLVQNQNPVQMANVLEMEFGEFGDSGQHAAVIAGNQDPEVAIIQLQQMEEKIVQVQSKKKQDVQEQIA